MGPIAILENNGLSKTRTRVAILETLELARAPLSGKEICERIHGQCDKSTVYRTLNTLFQKKVLQRVIIDHEVKFALRISGEGGGHENDHLHFKCSSCDTLFCLTEIEVNEFKLPQGFTKEENQFLVIGKCNTCQS